MPRCCEKIPQEFEPSYVSVLVFGANPGALRSAVHNLENSERITSCFTAWCARCSGTYFLTTDLHAFPTPSAHHTHKLCLLNNLRDSGAYLPRKK